MDLGANLAGFAEGFGGQVGTKLGPSGNKTRPHKQSKKCSLFGKPPDQFLMNFGSQLGSPGGGRQVVMLMGFRLLGLLGAKMGPRAPKKPQEAPKTGSKTDFGAILVDFWLIFWLFFGWFGG